MSVTSVPAAAPVALRSVRPRAPQGCRVEQSSSASPDLSVRLRAAAHITSTCWASGWALCSVVFSAWSTRCSVIGFSERVAASVQGCSSGPASEPVLTQRAFSAFASRGSGWQASCRRGSAGVRDHSLLCVLTATVPDKRTGTGSAPDEVSSPGEPGNLRFNGLAFHWAECLHRGSRAGAKVPLFWDTPLHKKGAGLGREELASRHSPFAVLKTTFCSRN